MEDGKGEKWQKFVRDILSGNIWTFKVQKEVDEEFCFSTRKFTSNIYKKLSLQNEHQHKFSCGLLCTFVIYFGFNLKKNQENIKTSIVSVLYEYKRFYQHY